MCSTRQRLAALLREGRVATGLTLRRAATVAEIAPATLSRWESGTCTPRVPELESLLRVLAIDSDEVQRILVSLDVPRAAKAAKKLNDRESQAPVGGTLLRAMRNRSGRSLAEVAIRLGVASSTVSRWESSHAHPPPQLLNPLFDLLGSTDEERACIQGSGVAKLNVQREPFDFNRYSREIESLETVSGIGEEAELRFLQLQTILWWNRSQPGAARLLRRVQVCYSKYLNYHSRYGEAAVQAEVSLNEIADQSDPLSIEALRVLARADVYRWNPARPHLGLFTLQRALKMATSEESRSGVLMDMAMFSELAGRLGEAANYARRARQVVHEDQQTQYLQSVG